MPLASKLSNHIEEREERNQRYHSKIDHRTDLKQAQDDSIAPWDQADKDLTDFHVAVFFDKYAVTEGHRLFVPVYNNDQVILACFESALLKGRQMVANGECDGFNIGLNTGTAAGQTVMYPHVHLIPRRNGDCEDPVGGVRNVIPGKGNYKK
jgi:diadenosine tetraphosphate (Ap4A) HIT family hydrolase